MSRERDLEACALRVAELAGRLVAEQERGGELDERQALLGELRRELEALDGHGALLALTLGLPPG